LRQIGVPIRMPLSTSTKSVNVKSIATFPKPVLAVYEGELVRIVHSGDVEGMSPAYQVIDQDGRSGWVSQAQCQIIDFAFLPPSTESLQTQLKAISQSLSGQTVSSRR
jgi:hypothetical protein